MTAAIRTKQRFEDEVCEALKHLIGLEVGVSVASVALRGEPTGVSTAWNADVVATAKRDLKPGELLDGEGGYTVWGKLLPADKSHRIGGLPLGLATSSRGRRPWRSTT